jgi:methyltransferase (TIGR00027 family)
MARTDNDTWDLASSVGATATMVAAARAMASTADDALIDDPFAEPLVRAVGVDFFTRLVTGELRPEDLDSDSESVGMQRMTDNMAVRTKFFDEFFLSATEGGIRQAVILASGLDSRAYRLAWPAGTTVYEIDQPDVIEFKTRTLAELGAEPTAERRTVAIDLRYNWPSALIEEGFDPNQPTAWSAEGLLGYLPPDAQDRLLDTITDLSAPGSRVAVESVPNIDPSDHEKAIERMQAASERWRDHGFDLDFAELVYLGDRNEAAAYLGDHGWQLNQQGVKDLFAANGLPPLDDDEDVGNFAELQYVSGTLPLPGREEDSPIRAQR